MWTAQASGKTNDDEEEKQNKIKKNKFKKINKIKTF